MLMDTIKNKYDINGVIGSGAFGRIYRITDKKVRTEYILKELTKINEESLNETDKKEYENEINFLKNVKGKNILNIIDYYQDDKDIFYYIILEKMDGDLEKLVKEKYKDGMKSSLIRKIFSQINSGLKDMIKKGKCHRDLKPSNILYSYINDEKTNFIIKLGDFGLSTDLKSTQYASNAGTKRFKAPEVEEGKFSNKCDLYSIGIILYYLKTGEYIFDGKRELDILNNKDKNIIKKDTDDELLNKLIRKLVVKDLHKRMEWDDYFKDPFFKVNDEDIKENIECK
jgi:calcium-dependent protein kinase